MKELIPIGILVIFIGMFLVFLGALSSFRGGDAKTKVAVGGFIGLIPFGFANDKRMLYFIIGLSALLVIVWIFIGLYWGRIR